MLWMGGRFLLTPEGVEELPGCGLCGLPHHLHGISQAEGPGGTCRHAGGTSDPICAEVAFDGGLFFPAADNRGRHTDGPKGADDHAEPARNAAFRIDGRVGGGAVGGAGGADPDAGGVLALPALGGELDMIHLHHPVAGLESLAGNDGPKDRPCPGVRSRAGQLTGVAPHAALGVDKDERTFYGHDFHLLRKGILPSIFKKPGPVCQHSLLTFRFAHPGLPKTMRDSDGVSSLSYFRFGMDDVCHLFPHQVRIVNISFSCISAIIYLTPKRAARVGNLDFRWSPDDPEPLLGPPHFSHMEALLETRARIETGEDVSPPMLRLLRQGSSVGGARPKCTIEWEDAFRNGFG